MRRIGLSCLFQRLYRFTTKEELSTIHSRNILSTLDFQFKSKMMDYTNRGTICLEERKTRFSKLDTDHPISLDHSSRTILFSLHRSMSEKEKEEEEKRVEQSNDINVSIDPSHFNTCIPRSELGTANTVASTRLLCPLAITRSLLASRSNGSALERDVMR